MSEVTDMLVRPRNHYHQDPYKLSQSRIDRETSAFAAFWVNRPPTSSAARSVRCALREPYLRSCIRGQWQEEPTARRSTWLTLSACSMHALFVLGSGCLVASKSLRSSIGLPAVPEPTFLTERRTCVSESTGTVKLLLGSCT